MPAAGDHRPRKANKKFIQEVVQDPSFKEGAFREQAEDHGLTTKQFMMEVLANPQKYQETTRKRAQFMKNILRH
jgi:hypothetical protein